MPRRLGVAVATLVAVAATLPRVGAQESNPYDSLFDRDFAHFEEAVAAYDVLLRDMDATRIAFRKANPQGDGGDSPPAPEAIPFRDRLVKLGAEATRLQRLLDHLGESQREEMRHALKSGPSSPQVFELVARVALHWDSQNAATIDALLDGLKRLKPEAVPHSTLGSLGELDSEPAATFLLQFGSANQDADALGAAARSGSVATLSALFDMAAVSPVDSSSAGRLSSLIRGQLTGMVVRPGAQVDPIIHEATNRIRKSKDDEYRACLTFFVGRQNVPRACADLASLMSPSADCKSFDTAVCDALGRALVDWSPSTATDRTECANTLLNIATQSLYDRAVRRCAVCWLGTGKVTDATSPLIDLLRDETTAASTVDPNRTGDTVVNLADACNQALRDITGFQASTSADWVAWWNSRHRRSPSELK